MNLNWQSLPRLFVDDIALEDCIQTHNEDDCVDLISSYNETSTNIYLRNIAASLIADPTPSCSCIQRYTPDLDGCIPVLR